MSKRRHDTSGGAFDALVHAIVGMGAAPRWAGAPPATAPGTLGRALGQGVLHARIPQGTRPAQALPLPAREMRHEGQRSVAELATLLWHAIGGPHEAPELKPWMAPPHTDPVIALTLSRRHLAEYAAPEPIDRSGPFPGGRVWLVEIERAKGDVPDGIAVWRSLRARIHQRVDAALTPTPPHSSLPRTTSRGSCENRLPLDSHRSRRASRRDATTSTKKPGPSRTFTARRSTLFTDA